MTTIPKPRVHAKMVQTIGTQILQGKFKSGENLPSEAEICQEYKVSRTALREAIKVLSAKGLIKTAPRRGSIVCDRQEWNYLDADILAWTHNKQPDPVLTRDLIEMRRIVEPTAAELAANRAKGQDIANIESAYQQMKDALPHDIDRCCLADVEFHSAVLRASKNICLQQMVNMISAALGHMFQVSAKSLLQSQQETLSVHFDVLEAIRLRNSEKAKEATLILIDFAEKNWAALPNN
ncbi:MAG: FadR family transcriptional regulator [SAR324 cluster bacterium]|nr:FadR family transcriptional regulator [SAR324 cluster bacterium]